MTLGFLDRLRAQPRPALPVVIHGISQTRAYWEGLRQGSALPLRKAVDPRGLVGVLDRVFLADRIGRGIGQIRIAGSALTEFAGIDARGLPLSCLFTPESRGLLADTLEKVFTGPALAEIDLGSDRAPGPLARLLLLPLDDEAGGRLILGMLGFAEETPARCKLQILSRREEVLTLAPVAAPAAEIPEFSQPIRRKGHLALVHSAE